MAIKDNREYRNFSLEVRKKDDAESDYKVSGYASTFETYELFKDGDAVFNERIEKDAFNDADLSDVIFLYNHEGMVYARQKNGTLNLNIDNKGLHIEADLSSTDESRKMYEAISKGLIDQMSFAFTVSDDDFEEKDNVFTRIIKRIDKVYDVSAVSIPANPGTDISAMSARSRFDGVIEKVQAERLERERREAQIQRIIAKGGGSREH